MLFILLSLSLCEEKKLKMAYPVGGYFHYIEQTLTFHMINYNFLVTKQNNQYDFEIKLGAQNYIQSTIGQFSDDPDAYGEDGHGSATTSDPNSGAISGWALTGQYPMFNGVKVGNIEPTEKYWITEFANYAFARYKFSTMKLPSRLVNVGPYAFYKCYNLASIIFNSEFTKLPEGAFYDCYSLQTVDFPGQLSAIGANAFYNCTSLLMIRTCSTQNIAFDNTISSFVKSKRPMFVVPKDYPFDTLGDTINPKLSFHKGFDWIELDGVRYDLVDTTIKITILVPGSKIIRQDVDLIRNLSALCVIGTDPNAYTNVVVNSDNKSYSVSDNAFEGVINLNNITLGNGIDAIGSNAFANSKLTHIEIPESIKTIKSGAFDNCNQLTHVKILGSPTMENSVFSNCRSLNNFTYCGNKTVNNNIFGSSTTDKSIYVAAYYPSNSFAGEQVIKRGDTVIVNGNTYVFSGGNLTVSGSGTITRDDVLQATSLSDMCTICKDHRTFEALNIQAGLTIAVNAFMNQTKLRNVILPNGMKAIPSKAFYLSSISTLSLPSSIQNIGESAFRFNGLTKLVVPIDILRIDSYAFADNVNLKDILYCGTNVPTIASNAFSNIFSNAKAQVSPSYDLNAFGSIVTTIVYAECGLAEPTKPPTPSETPTRSPQPTQSKLPPPTQSRIPPPPTQSRIPPPPTQSRIPEMTQVQTKVLTQDPLPIPPPVQTNAPAQTNVVPAKTEQANNAVQNNNKDGGKKNNNAAIIGGAVGGFLFLLLLILIVIYAIYKTSKHAIESDELDESFLSDSGSGYNERSVSEFSNKLSIDDSIAVQTVEPEATDGHDPELGSCQPEDNDAMEHESIDDESPMAESEPQIQEIEVQNQIKQQIIEPVVEAEPEEMIVLVAAAPVASVVVPSFDQPEPEVQEQEQEPEITPKEIKTEVNQTVIEQEVISTIPVAPAVIAAPAIKKRKKKRVVLPPMEETNEVVTEETEISSPQVAEQGPEVPETTFETEVPVVVVAAAATRGRRRKRAPRPSMEENLSVTDNVYEVDESAPRREVLQEQLSTDSFNFIEEPVASRKKIVKRKRVRRPVNPKNVELDQLLNDDWTNNNIEPKIIESSPVDEPL